MNKIESHIEITKDCLIYQSLKEIIEKGMDACFIKRNSIISEYCKMLLNGEIKIKQ